MMMTRFLKYTTFLILIMNSSFIKAQENSEGDETQNAGKQKAWKVEDEEEFGYYKIPEGVRLILIISHQSIISMRQLFVTPRRVCI